MSIIYRKKKKEIYRDNVKRRCDVNIVKTKKSIQYLLLTILCLRRVYELIKILKNTRTRRMKYYSLYFYYKIKKMLDGIFFYYYLHAYTVYYVKSDTVAVDKKKKKVRVHYLYSSISIL